MPRGPKLGAAILKTKKGSQKGGERLMCTAEFLQTVLGSKKQDLLILIVLRRYDKGVGNRESQFWHTTAVVHVKQSLQFDFYLGSQNLLHVNRY